MSRSGAYWLSYALGNKGDNFTTEALSLTTLCYLLVRLRICAAVPSTPPYIYIYIYIYVVQWHTLYIYLVSYFFFKVDDGKWLYSGYSWCWKTRYIYLNCEDVVSGLIYLHCWVNSSVTYFNMFHLPCINQICNINNQQNAFQCVWCILTAIATIFGVMLLLQDTKVQMWFVVSPSPHDN
jgi:hypothetical protein